MTSQLVVLGFDGEETAEGVFDNLEDMQQRGLLQLEDAVIVSRGQSAAVQVKQTDSRRGRTAAAGAGIGLLAGWLIGGPVGGAVVGSIIGALHDRGVDDHFVDDVGHRLGSNSSAIFLLVQSADAPKVIDELKPFNASVVHTSLTDEQERTLREGLRSNH
jgi:uncharacterized membrane protein